MYNKNYILVLVLYCIALPSYGGSFYIGGFTGSAELRYNTDGIITDAIASNPEVNDALSLIRKFGGNVERRRDSVSSTSRYVIGYRNDDRWGIELFAVSMNAFSIGLHADIAASGSASDSVDILGNKLDYSLSGSLQLEGNIIGSADLRVYGLQVNHYIPITKELDIVLGIGLGYGKSDITLNGNISGLLEYDVGGSYNDGPAYNAAGIMEYSIGRNSRNSFVGILPVISGGILYRLNSWVSIMGSYDVYGIPATSKSISTIGVGLLLNY